MEWRALARQIRGLTAAMTYRDTAEKLAAWRGQIAELRQKMRDAQASVEPEPVQRLRIRGSEGSKRLSQLFGGNATCS